MFIFKSPFLCLFYFLDTQLICLKNTCIKNKEKNIFLLPFFRQNGLAVSFLFRLPFGILNLSQSNEKVTKRNGKKRRKEL